MKAIADYGKALEHIRAVSTITMSGNPLAQFVRADKKVRVVVPQGDSDVFIQAIISLYKKNI